MAFISTKIDVSMNTASNANHGMLAEPRRHTENSRDAVIGRLEINVPKEDQQIDQRVTIQCSRVEGSQSLHVWPNHALDGPSHKRKYRRAIPNSKLRRNKNVTMRSIDRPPYLSRHD